MLVCPWLAYPGHHAARRVSIPVYDEAGYHQKLVEGTTGICMADCSPKGLDLERALNILTKSWFVQQSTTVKGDVVLLKLSGIPTLYLRCQSTSKGCNDLI